MIETTRENGGRRGSGRLRKVNVVLRPEDQARINYLLDRYMTSSESQVVRLAIRHFAEHWQEARQRYVERRKRTRGSTPDHSTSRKTVYMRIRDFKRIGAIQAAAGLPSSSEAIRSAIRWDAERHSELAKAGGPRR